MSYDDQKRATSLPGYYINMLLGPCFDEIFHELELIVRFPYKQSWMCKHWDMIEPDLQEGVKKADRVLIENLDKVLKVWECDSMIFKWREEDADDIEEDEWYWWLDKIKAGTFPWEHIPEHLQDLCRKFYKDEKK